MTWTFKKPLHTLTQEERNKAAMELWEAESLGGITENNNRLPVPVVYLLVLTMEPSEAQAQPGNDEAVSVMGRRMKGYRLALEEYEVKLGAGSIRQAPATFEGGEAAFLRAWEDGLRPTGVLSMSDAAAAGVLQAARHLGLRVPDDLSIVGFDDLPLTRFTDPPLTTVHQPVRRKGEEAARMLLRALSPDSSRAGEHRVLETRLVVRRSTAPPKPRSQEVIGDG